MTQQITKNFDIDLNKIMSESIEDVESYSSQASIIGKQQLTYKKAFRNNLVKVFTKTLDIDSPLSKIYKLIFETEKKKLNKLLNEVSNTEDVQTLQIIQNSKKKIDTQLENLSFVLSIFTKLYINKQAISININNLINIVSNLFSNSGLFKINELKQIIDNAIDEINNELTNLFINFEAKLDTLTLNKNDAIIDTFIRQVDEEKIKEILKEEIANKLDSYIDSSSKQYFSSDTLKNNLELFYSNYKKIGISQTFSSKDTDSVLGYRNFRLAQMYLQAVQNDAEASTSLKDLAIHLSKVMGYMDNSEPTYESLKKQILTEEYNLQAIDETDFIKAEIQRPLTTTSVTSIAPQSDVTIPIARPPRGLLDYGNLLAPPPEGYQNSPLTDNNIQSLVAPPPEGYQNLPPREAPPPEGYQNLPTTDNNNLPPIPPPEAPEAPVAAPEAPVAAPLVEAVPVPVAAPEAPLSAPAAPVAAPAAPVAAPEAPEAPLSAPLAAPAAAPAAPVAAPLVEAASAVPVAAAPSGYQVLSPDASQEAATPYLNVEPGPAPTTGKEQVKERQYNLTANLVDTKEPIYSEVRNPIYTDIGNPRFYNSRPSNNNYQAPPVLNPNDTYQQVYGARKNSKSVKNPLYQSYNNRTYDLAPPEATIPTADGSPYLRKREQTGRGIKASKRKKSKLKHKKTLRKKSKKKNKRTRKK